LLIVLHFLFVFNVIYVAENYFNTIWLYIIVFILEKCLSIVNFVLGLLGFLNFIINWNEE